MTYVQRFLAVTTASMIALIAMDAVGADKAKAKQYMTDAAITTQVVTSLSTNPGVRSGNIITNTYNGKVQLCGFVGDQNEASIAVREAKTTRGVREVINALIIASGNPKKTNTAAKAANTVKTYAEDTEITANVKRVLFDGTGLSTTGQVNVVTVYGNVALCGFVDTKNIAEKAEKLAKSVEGVKSIQNRLLVKE